MSGKVTRLTSKQLQLIKVLSYFGYIERPLFEEIIGSRAYTPDVQSRLKNARHRWLALRRTMSSNERHYYDNLFGSVVTRPGILHGEYEVTDLSRTGRLVSIVKLRDRSSRLEVPIKSVKVLRYEI